MTLKREKKLFLTIKAEFFFFFGGGGTWGGGGVNPSIGIFLPKAWGNPFGKMRF